MQGSSCTELKRPYHYPLVAALHAYQEQWKIVE